MGVGLTGQEVAEPWYWHYRGVLEYQDRHPSIPEGHTFSRVKQDGQPLERLWDGGIIVGY